MLLKSGGFAAAIGTVALSGALLVATSTSILAQETACGTDRTIDIAEMSWESASVLGHIHHIILTEGYGCNAELVPGDTVPTSASMMGRGIPALAPELWMSTIEDRWAEAEEEDVVVELGPAISGGTLEGLWVPTWVRDEYDIVTIEDAIARPDLFPDPDNPGQGRVYGGPPGWAAELAVDGVYRAYDMADAGWNLFSVADATLVAAIQRAFIQEEPILFYYWSPAAIMGQVDAHKLEMPPYDAEAYGCNTDPDCAEAGKSDWPSSRVILGAASWLPEEAPAVAEYLGQAGLPASVISEIAAYGEENGVTSRVTAEDFLRDRQELWTGWVPDDVAERVLASL